MTKSDGKPDSYYQDQTFKRSVFKHLLRYFYLLMLTGLAVSVPMSMIERAHLHRHIDLGSELFMMFFIMGMCVLILPSALFEVNGLIVKDETLKVMTMFMPVEIAFDEIISFTTPQYLKWGILRTKRGFYLINRRDIHDFDKLCVLLAPKLPSTTQ